MGISIRALADIGAGNDMIERNPLTAVKVRLATLLANDTDADSDVLNISVSASSANGGTISVSGGCVLYTPANGFTNADSFTYTITDGCGGSATGMVTVPIQSPGAPTQNLIVTGVTADSLGEFQFIDTSGAPVRFYRTVYP